jgi:hypothetical protein
MMPSLRQLFELLGATEATVEPTDIGGFPVVVDGKLVRTPPYVIVAAEPCPLCGHQRCKCGPNGPGEEYE